MDSIREQLDNLADMTSEELQTLQDSIVSEFKTAKESMGKDNTPDRETVQNMQDLLAAKKAVAGELTRRETEATELANAAEAAVAEFENSSDEADNTDEAPADDENLAEAATDPADEKKDEEVPSDTAEEVAPEGTPEEEATETPEAEAQEPVEGSPEEEATETPEEEAQEPSDESDDSKTEDDEEKKPLKDFSAESEEVSEEVSVASTDESEVISEELAASETSEEAPEIAELSAETTIEESATEEPVTASTPNEFQAPEGLRPETVKAVNPVVITAGADIAGIPMGTEFNGLSDVASAIVSRRNAMGRTSGGDGEQHTVARFSVTYPDEFTLSSTDMQGNHAKIEAVVSPDAIVAAGGLTAPVETSYDIYELGETAVRPVRDSLPRFAADRGGIRFMTPPTIADLNGAVSVWTLQDDIDAATPGAPDPVKPCLRVAAGTEVTVYTEAIPLCLTFGNLSSRAYPELVERHTKLGMVQHARFAENRLLTRLGSLSTSVSAAAELGAARDIFVQLEQAAAAYRSRYRLDPEQPLRAIFPEWFKNALRADVTKQLPGDGQDVTFNLADSTINKWLDSRKINVTWHLDGEEGQIFGAQATGALNGFPTDLIWYLFAEGTFVFLDGSTLDLGLVRDSTLNGTNDYKIFLETFEGLAKVGVESLRVTSKLKIKGSSSGTTAIA